MEAHGTAATHGGPAPRLRPLSLGESLDVAIKLCRANGATLLRAVAVVIVPIQLLATVLMVSTGGASQGVFGSAPKHQSTTAANTYIAGQVGAAILQAIAVGLVTAVCVRVFARAYLGQGTDWRESLRHALQRIPQMLWLGLLYTLALLAAVVVLVIPAALANTAAAIVVVFTVLFVLFVWIYISWSFALPALFVEDVRGVPALRRSFALVSGRWWPTFATIIVGYILATIVAAVTQAIFAAIIAVAGVDNGSAAAVILIGLAGLVGLALTAPFQAALLLVIYFDLRVRKEGFAIELLAERFGGGVLGDAPGVPAPAPAALDAGSPRTPYWPAPRPPDEPPPPFGWVPPEISDDR